MPVCLFQMESGVALEKEIPELRTIDFSYLMTRTERGIIFIDKYSYFLTPIISEEEYVFHLWWGIAVIT